MKKVLLLFLLTALTASIKASVADSIQYRNGKVIIEEVIAVPNTTSTQLYGKAKLFFTTAFNSSKSVIQSEDIDNHVIVGKGKIVNFEDQGFGGIYRNFTIIIQTKDNRYRYTITDMETEETGMAPMKSTAEHAAEIAKENGDSSAIEGYYSDFEPFLSLLKEQMQIREEDNW